MAKHDNIFLIGQMGSGKTSVGQYLADKLGLKFIDADRIMHSCMGMSVAEIFSKEGESGFRQREVGLIDELTRLSRIILATGGGAVLHAASRTALKTRGIVIYLQASVVTLSSRAEADHSRPLLHGQSSLAVFTRLQEQRAAFYRETADFIYTVDTDTVAGIAHKIIHDLKKISFVMA